MSNSLLLTSFDPKETSEPTRKEPLVAPLAWLRGGPSTNKQAPRNGDTSEGPIGHVLFSVPTP
jgi:hypothetical protein